MKDKATETGQDQPADTQPEKTLDQLLAEFDADQGAAEPAAQPETPPQTPTPDGADPRLERVFGYVEQQIVKDEKAAQDEGLDASVKAAKAFDGLGELPDAIVRDRIIAFAFDNPRFADAFTNRAKNPEAYQAILREAVSTLSRNAPVDPNLTADIAAARESVQGQSSNPPPERTGPTLEDKARMGRQAWNQHMQSLIRGG